MESFTPKVRHPENDRIKGETDGKVPFSMDGVEREVLSEVESGPIQLTPDQVKLIDAALDRQGFLPGDLQFANPEKLQEGFSLLASATDRIGEKKALTYIVESVRDGVK